jgi:hypothetical protein
MARDSALREARRESVRPILTVMDQRSAFTYESATLSTRTSCKTSCSNCARRFHLHTLTAQAQTRGCSSAYASAVGEMLMLGMKCTAHQAL